MASKRAVRRKVCERKNRYPDQDTARMEAGRGFHQRGEDLHPYRCAHCGGWHIGHVPAFVQKARAESRARRGTTAALAE